MSLETLERRLQLIERVLKLLFSTLAGIVCLGVGSFGYVWHKYLHAETPLDRGEQWLIGFFAVAGVVLLGGQAAIGWLIDQLIKLTREGVAAWKGRAGPPSSGGQ